MLLQLHFAFLHICRALAFLFLQRLGTRELGYLLSGWRAGEKFVYMCCEDRPDFVIIFSGEYMTESVFDLVVQILREYERITGKSCFEIANRMGIEVSNYYLYRAGIGNPTCKTIDKIIEVVLAEHPEIICAIVNRLNENLKGMLETQELSKKA